MRTDKILEVTIANGGGTFDPKTGLQVEPRGGYGVGVVQGTAIIVSAENTDLVGDAAKLVARKFPGHFLGTWVQGDKIHIDPVLWVPSREVAEKLGRAAKQEAIWDFGSGQEIELG